MQSTAGFVLRFACSLCVLASALPLAGCATATSPDLGTTDGGTHDTSIVDTGSAGGDTSTTDTKSDGACLAPKKVCAGVCVDVTSDRNNCGDCGKACGETASCISGACGAVGCTKDEVSCPDGKCANLLTDPDHCGDCETKCGLDGSGTPKLCVDAKCTLDCSKKVDCGGATCVDLMTDDANCGTCGKICATGTKCAAGSCVTCPTTGTICGSKCVDTSTDPANCGACGTACTAGHSCTAGKCVCAPGLTDCSGVCKDLSSDGTNCGTCGKVCASGTFCNTGTCSSTCPTGKSGCGGSCIDTTDDPLNCGGCGVTCGATAPYCSGGKCVSLPKCNAGPYKVLFYGQIGSKESPYVPTGSTVTVATSASWKAMTTTDFSSYQLIVIGEGGGLLTTTPTPWDDAQATKSIWGPAITGRVVVTTLDPVAHAGTVGAPVFLKASLAWAAGGPGTGLYVGPDYGSVKYNFLSGFGSWTELGQVAPDDYAGDTAHVALASHPTMTGSTDASLSSWSYSFHGGLTSIPSTFVTVAQGTATPTGGTSTTTTIVAAKDAPCSP